MLNRRKIILVAKKVCFFYGNKYKATIHSFKEGQLSYISTLDGTEHRTDCTCQAPQTQDIMCKHNLMHLKKLVEYEHVNVDDFVPRRYLLAHLAKVYGFSNHEIEVLQVLFIFCICFFRNNFIMFIYRALTRRPHLNTKLTHLSQAKSLNGKIMQVWKKRKIQFVTHQ